MKLILVNFRKYARREFTFDDNFILILGKSGSGKSTVFIAMNFAITGEGKKLQMYGKKSCSVTFASPQHRDIEIVRTKGPCRLRVRCGGSVYEDAVAQSVIDELFQNWETGYVAQKFQKSFVLMSPLEKLQLIERLAFDKFDIGTVYQKCKDAIRDRKHMLTVTSTEKTTLRDTLTQLNVPKPIEQTNEVTDEASDDCAQLEAEHARIATQLSNLRTSIDVAKSKLAFKRRVEDELTLLLRNAIDVDVAFDETRLNALISAMAKWTAYSDARKRLEPLRRDLAVESGKLVECANKAIILAELSDIAMIKQLRQSIVNARSLRDNLATYEAYQQTHAVIFTCPVCRSSVGLKDDRLVKDDAFERVTYEDMKANERSLAHLRCKVNEIDSIELKIRDMVTALGYDDVDVATSPSRVETMYDQLRSYDRVELLNDKLVAQQRECDRLRCEQPTTVDDIATLTRQIRLAQAHSTAVTEKRALLATMNDLDDAVIDRLKLQLLLEQASYDLCVARIENVKAQKWNDVTRLERVEERLQRDLPRAVKLQSLVKLAEKMSVLEIIELVNFHSENYIDKFFDDELSVKLVFDEKINVDVKHNGHDSDLSSLSGGELARVVLAFTLAFSEISNTEVLLLDECLASLDLDTNDAVMQVVKENYVGKIICVSHQTTKGVFDAVINLDNNDESCCA